MFCIIENMPPKKCPKYLSYRGSTIPKTKSADSQVFDETINLANENSTILKKRKEVESNTTGSMLKPTTNKVFLTDKSAESMDDNVDEVEDEEERNESNAGAARKLEFRSSRIQEDAKLCLPAVSSIMSSPLYTGFTLEPLTSDSPNSIMTSSSKDS